MPRFFFAVFVVLCLHQVKIPFAAHHNMKRKKINILMEDFEMDLLQELKGLGVNTDEGVQRMGGMLLFMRECL